MNLSEIEPEFSKALTTAKISRPDALTTRLLASLLAKRFVILTGLSGSGKTKVAQAVAQWLSTSSASTKRNIRFQVGDMVKSSQVDYEVVAADRIAATFLQKKTDTLVTLPYELIDNWITCIEEQGLTEDNTAREIRDAVKVETRYSPQLNSFETHLRAAAFHVLNGNSLPTYSSSQYAVVPVGADWTSNESIVGYRDLINDTYVRTPALDIILSAVSSETEIPHFLILDEMNLSHVERYFADFLSLIESNEPLALHDGPCEINGVPPRLDSFPRNLFVIGTVNVDETTYMFSPKVLDRANAIEFRISESDMDNFLNAPSKPDLSSISGKGAAFGEMFVRCANEDVYLDDGDREKLKSEMIMVFLLLQSCGAEFGYRTAHEIGRFVHFYKELTDETDWDIDDAIDAQLCQKILPKINGSARKVEPVLRGLAAICWESLKSEAQTAATSFDERFNPLAMDGDGHPSSPPDRKAGEVTPYPITFEQIS
ncbi:MAG: hypothetical protein L3K26_11990, partial [Candidatus Hydrogenedentes bacterium]|nr:hypothetical protein [Candidatus Hydrogenedentota bacterium]